MKLKIVTVVAIVIALALGTGIGILAAGSLGSQEDPLVTLSYLNERFKTDLLKDIDVLINERGNEISAKVDEALGTIDKDGNTVPADAFLVVTISDGETVTCDEGTELLLREGSALIIGDAVTDTTLGQAVGAGSVAQTNHMLMVTAKGSGITASGTVKLLIRGGYTITR